MIKRIKKGFILPRADVAERSHVATRRHVSKWHVDTRVCVMCMRETHVCASHVCVEYINGWGASVIEFKLTA